MLRRSLFHIFFLACIGLSVFTGSFVARIVVHQAAAAQTLPSTRNPFPELQQAGSGYTGGRNTAPRDLRLVVADFIRLALGLIGTILLLIMLYAGYLWFSARGNDEQVETAKKTIRNAVIGLFLIMMTYSMVTFIFRSVFVPGTQDATSEPGETKALDNIINALP